MSRKAASTRLSLLLAMLPWLAENSPVLVKDVCERYGITRKSLIADIEFFSLTGLPPYTPDVMFDAFIEDDYVRVRTPYPFDKPLNLTTNEGLGLILAAQAVSVLPQVSETDTLSRAIAKLAASLGLEKSQIAVDETLSDSQRAHLATINEAKALNQSVEIVYYAHARNEHTTRIIDPYQLALSEGFWYISAWCHKAEGLRNFRLDRVIEATLLEQQFEAKQEVELPGDFTPPDHFDQVQLHLGKDARWLTNEHSPSSVAEHPDGSCTVTVAVGEPGWLERLLVQLGPEATVVSDLPEYKNAASNAAQRILKRYAIT